MNRTMHAPLLAVVLIAMAAAVQAAPPAAATKVNGKTIPQSSIDALVSAQVAKGQTDTPELRNAVREEMIRREVLTQEAERKGFHKKPDVVSQIAMTRQGVLIGAYLQNYVENHPVTDEMVKAEYDNLRKTLGEKEYKVRHILVGTEEEAKAVIDKLKAGEKFEELAKQSKDPGSKERGGDLGWSNKASYVKPFSDAMVALEKGKFTETPVKSDFGLHIIQLDDVRDIKAPTVEEIKPQLSQRLQQKMVEKHVQELRAKAKVQ
ncbi:MAG: peptidylprolyl isomerase [Gammaproteobacteria bacterium]|nr:peptidylprolyl isomerase [Gammaproteobacteria bacterium]MBU1414010.1 peptidylprolyl isomerase [Gammaproteobacteria bacterium]